MHDSTGLAGLKILIVEDDYFIATEMEEIVRGFGADVLGPVGRLDMARKVAQQVRPDGALLDVRLDGETIYPLADELIASGVPFILLTGYDTGSILEAYRTLPQLRKPVDSAALRDLALTLFGSAA